MNRRILIFSAATLMLMSLAVAISAQPVQVTDVPNNSANFTGIDDLVYFTSGNALWRTDGTAEGTILLRSGLPTAPFSFRKFKNYAIFLTGSDHPWMNEGETTQIWRTDGTPGGTIQLLSRDFIAIRQGTADYLFFEGIDASTGLELYRTDGSTSGTFMLKDIYPGEYNGFRGNSAVLGNQLIFSASASAPGTELWKSDGTPEGTVMIKEVDIAGNTNSIVHNNLYYFRARTPEHGAEPWVSDGTADGTRLLKDMVPGTEDPRALYYAIGHNEWLYFLDTPLENLNGAGNLWKTSGTAASTVQVTTVGEEEGLHRYHSFLVYEDKVYFFDRYNSYRDYLWVTDGTASGTHTFFSLVTTGGSISFFDVVNDYLLFTGSRDNVPHNFYRSDGTSAGTEEFARFKARAPGVFPRDITKAGDLVFYADHDGLTDPTTGYSYAEEDYYHLYQADGNTSKSMRTLWGANTIGSRDIAPLNGSIVFTTLNDQEGAEPDQKRLWLYDPSKTPPSTASFTLVDANTDEDVKRLLEGAIIANPRDVPINIRFDPVGAPGSVVFKLNDVTVRTETAPPYSLAGDIKGDYAAWQGANAGEYKLTATGYSEAGGKGTPGESLTINFTIEDEDPSPEECTASGTILREYWGNVSGNYVSAIPVNTAPTSTSQLTIFQGLTNAGTNYGARIRGYVCPPATGSYTFWISSNDHSELWLSTDDNPANKRRIAWVTGATQPLEWTKYASQKSAAVSLTAGKRYYIEALHKQGVGSDHVAVGWQLPGGTLERPIPGLRLSPPDGSENIGPVVTIQDPDDGQTFTSPADVLITATASDQDGSIAKVEFFSYDVKLGEDQTSPYQYMWKGAPEGTHILRAKATDNLGAASISSPVTITVTGEGCTASGTITRDYWAGVPGSRVSDIPVNTTPTSTSEIIIFEGPANVGTNYASRIRGYICPPATGNYTFYISSNDHSELLLSTDDDPANKVRIAYVTGATDPRQWDKYTSQRSVSIPLVEGNRYYIEALHKQGAGTDHIAVGWRWPNFTLERPIPGHHLSPFGEDAQTMAFSADGSMTEKAPAYSAIDVYPNPAQSGEVELTIAGYEDIYETVETGVEIINMTGDLVFSETISCGGGCGSYLMEINKQLVPGLYLINLRTNGVRFSKRLLVK